MADVLSNLLTFQPRLGLPIGITMSLASKACVKQTGKNRMSSICHEHDKAVLSIFHNPGLNNKFNVCAKVYRRVWSNPRFVRNFSSSVHLTISSSIPQRKIFLFDGLVLHAAVRSNFLSQHGAS
jgi:hypothetical protein